MLAYNPRSAKSVVMLLLLIATCAASCKRDGGKSAALSPGSSTAVKAQLNVLRDSVEVKWRDVSAADQQLLGTTGLLLRELKGQPGINPTQLQGLEQANRRLKLRRYTQQTMANSALIDQYDAAQDSLLRALYPVAAPNGDAPSANIRGFVEGIQQTESGVVGIRVSYDRAARQYNDYLKLHQTELQNVGGKYAALKPLALFTIQL